MHKTLRTNKDGSKYYSFLYTDHETGKRVRLPRETIRKRFGHDITNEAEAKKAQKILDADYESLASKLERRAAWEEEFYEFKKLLTIYAEKQKKRAPNSYRNNVHYLRYYVLHFFLIIQKCNNINSWVHHYESFREWLEHDAYLIKTPTKLISFGAKNHCIKTLNTFVRHLHDLKIIEKLDLCAKFPSHLLNERDIDDVISNPEMEKIFHQLKLSHNHSEAIFFRLLYFTGLRFNEGLGLSLADIFPGKVQNKTLENLLNQYNIEYFGYIVLSSQPDHETRGIRNSNGEVKRKPLKGRKKICEKHSRIVVVTCKILWSELAKIYNNRIDQIQSKIWGDNPSNYLFFDSIDKTTSTNKMRTAYQTLGLRYRSWHCCRHSCATNIIGETGDYNLARLWIGHKSPAIIEKYVHVHQAIVRSAQKIDHSNKRFLKISL